MARNSTNPFRIGESGGIGTRIMFAVLTLCVLVAGVVVLVNHFQHQQKVLLRAADNCSIEGLQFALESNRANRQWHAAIGKTECSGNSWYEVSVTPGDSSGTPMLRVVAEGHSGSVTRRQICVLQWQWKPHDGVDSGWIQQSIKQE